MLGSGVAGLAWGAEAAEPWGAAAFGADGAEGEGFATPASGPNKCTTMPEGGGVGSGRAKAGNAARLARNAMGSRFK